MTGVGFSLHTSEIIHGSPTMIWHQHIRYIEVENKKSDIWLAKIWHLQLCESSHETRNITLDRNIPQLTLWSTWKKIKSTENFKLSRHVILNIQRDCWQLSYLSNFFRKIDDKPMVIISVHLFKFPYLERVYKWTRSLK